ncbi:MAG: preprotein translocase subunit SecE [Elusimicrobia bacterium]|nr:preprotein translocase subunit SecE [Elusimicrobiota bacterium]
MGFNPVQFARESYRELGKVTWLSKQQMAASTVVVLVLVFLVSIYVSLVDFILSIVLGAFLGR